MVTELQIECMERAAHQDDACLHMLFAIAVTLHDWDTAIYIAERWPDTFIRSDREWMLDDFAQLIAHEALAAQRLQ